MPKSRKKYWSSSKKTSGLHALENPKSEKLALKLNKKLIKSSLWPKFKDPKKEKAFYIAQICRKYVAEVETFKNHFQDDKALSMKPDKTIKKSLHSGQKKFI